MWRVAAAAWGLAEATLFFVVPDVLLTWIAGFRPRALWPAVGACLLGALAGGVLMLESAHRAPGHMRALLDRVPAVSAGLIASTGAALERDYGRQMLRAGFSGVPYKILAVESGARGVPTGAFLAWSVPARLSRWVLVSLLALGVSRLVRSRLGRPDRVLWSLWGAVWCIVYAAYFAVMGW